MFLSCKVLKFSIKLRKVFIVFGREIMKDPRQVKKHISDLGIGCNRVLWEKHALRNDIMTSIRIPLNVRGLGRRVLVKIKCTGQGDTLHL